jgi:hypothetical protein
VEVEHRTRLAQFVISMSEIADSQLTPATTATLRQTEETAVNTVPVGQDHLATEFATSATDSFDSYADYLRKWVEDGHTSLPLKPPFDEPPRRAEAWALWWDAVEGCRANKVRL